MAICVPSGLRTRGPDGIGNARPRTLAQRPFRSPRDERVTRFELSQVVPVGQ